jgi:ParB/RepB/Spo0J family partition protein
MSIETKFLPVNLLDFPKDGERGFRTFNRDFATQMASSIDEQGQLQPIQVRPSTTKPGRYIVFDGKHRAYAIRNILKKELIEAKVFEDLDETEAELAGIAANMWRQNLSPAQQASCAKKWFGHYLAKYPEKVGLNRSGDDKAEIADMIERAAKAAAAATAAAVAAGETVTPEAPKTKEELKEIPTFAEQLAAATGTSVAKAKRTQKVAIAFTQDQLDMMAAQGIKDWELQTLAKIANRAKREEIVNLISSGMDFQIAVDRIMGEKAPKPNDGKSDAAREAEKAANEPEPVAKLTDDEWFAAECGDKAKLFAFPDKYRQDAILYRQINEARHVFRGRAKKCLGKMDKSIKIGPFASAVGRIINISHPKDWIICPGCSGKGVANGIDGTEADCRKCFRAGYVLKTEEYL